MKKKKIENQNYEEYWSLTLEYSDICGPQFNNVLKKIIDFIDENVFDEDMMSPEQYKKLTKDIGLMYSKVDPASTRKSINQYFKLGFINNHGSSYHPLSKQFIAAVSDTDKRFLFSRIFYENASFKRSYSNLSNENEVSLFVRTLSINGLLSKEDLLALMTTCVSDYKAGYLTRDQLDAIKSNMDHEFSDRKYNQLRYIINMFKLSGIKYENKTFYYIQEPKEVELSDDNSSSAKKRDPYLQKLYKLQLIEESKRLFDKSVCGVEKIAYPVLIASHIKPYKDSDLLDAFNPDNGILLSKNIDSLFDLGYITFNDDGTIVYGDNLDESVKNAIKNCKIDSKLLTANRIKYLRYHKMVVYEKRLKKVD